MLLLFKHHFLLCIHLFRVEDQCQQTEYAILVVAIGNVAQAVNINTTIFGLPG